MKKNRLFPLVSGLLLLACFLLMIWQVQYRENLKELQKLQNVRNTTELYLKQQYPEYNMQITDIKYIYHKHVGSYYAGAVKSSNNLEYVLGLNSDGNFDFLILNDSKSMDELKEMLEIKTKDEIPYITGMNINVSINPIPYGDPNYHNISVEINIFGSSITSKQLSEKIVHMRDEFISKTKDKYILANMNLQYFYNNKRIGLRMSGQSLKYSPEQLVGIMEGQ